jgi:hypothetical protein
MGYTEVEGDFRVSIQYLVPCSCGRKVPIGSQQAGESIICECGVKLEIPRLLELKKLDKVIVQDTQSKPSFVWGVGHSLILSGAVILVVVAVLCFLVLRYGSSDPYGKTPDQIRAYFQKIPPTASWDSWLYFKQVGINPPKERIDRAMEGEYAKRQMHLTYLGIAAAGGIALCIAGAFIVRRNRPIRSSALPS